MVGLLKWVALQQLVSIGGRNAVAQVGRGMQLVDSLLKSVLSFGSSTVSSGAFGVRATDSDLGWAEVSGRTEES